MFLLFCRKKQSYCFFLSFFSSLRQAYPLKFWSTTSVVVYERVWKLNKKKCVINKLFNMHKNIYSPNTDTDRLSSYIIILELELWKLIMMTERPSMNKHTVDNMVYAKCVKNETITHTVITRFFFATYLSDY